ncbi:MAG: pirin family protein [Thermoplasmata archaeon]
MAERLRPIARRLPGIETIEGAGVRLRRSFGQREVPLLDPFLLLDHFGSENPDDYMAGFPWHPHRGIETVTYMLEGRVAHGDTLGHEGVIDRGDIQWMRAGSGIIHQEMPERAEGRLDGFQLWVNLPARDKMSTPRYQGIASGEIPEIELPSGARARVVAGRLGGVEGPVRGIAVDPTYVDLELPPGATLRLPTAPGHTVVAHVIGGAGRFAPEPAPVSPRGETIHFGPGDAVEVRAEPSGLRFLLAEGRPLGEPVAWRGPIVMNTPEEIREAVRDLRHGGFLRHRQPIYEE